MRDDGYQDFVASGRVLVIDDSSRRLEALKRHGFIPADAAWAATAAEGEAQATSADWDWIWFDHDLNSLITDPSGRRRSHTGADLAEALVASGRRPGRTVVHSTTIEGSARIVATLRAAGLPVLREAITRLIPGEGLD
jgi:hypothetical protein